MFSVNVMSFPQFDSENLDLQALLN